MRRFLGAAGLFVAVTLSGQTVPEPTFPERQRGVETHALDCGKPYYDQFSQLSPPERAYVMKSSSTIDLRVVDDSGLEKIIIINSEMSAPPCSILLPQKLFSKDQTTLLTKLNNVTVRQQAKESPDYYWEWKGDLITTTLYPANRTSLLVEEQGFNGGKHYKRLFMDTPNHVEDYNGTIQR